MMPFQERKSGGGAFIIAVCACLVLLAVFLICFVMNARADAPDHWTYLPLVGCEDCAGVPTPTPTPRPTDVPPTPRPTHAPEPTPIPYVHNLSVRNKTGGTLGFLVSGANIGTKWYDTVGPNWYGSFTPGTYWYYAHGCGHNWVGYSLYFPPGTYVLRLWCVVGRSGEPTLQMEVTNVVWN